VRSPSDRVLESLEAFRTAVTVPRSHSVDLLQFGSGAFAEVCSATVLAGMVVSHQGQGDARVPELVPTQLSVALQALRQTSR
jgi:hypothetical protein